MLKLLIMGTEYDYIEVSERDYADLKGVDGFCNNDRKLIAIEKNPYQEEVRTTKQDEKEYKKFVKRHEVIHAFWAECGMKHSVINDEWAVNLLAENFPKMLKVFKEIGAL